LRWRAHKMHASRRRICGKHRQFFRQLLARMCLKQR
jgi:hypothetical protein